MAVSMHTVLGTALRELRFQPTDKRIRALRGGAVVADSTRAALVWEPRRVVPTYAVPATDVLGELRPVLDPRVAAHTCPGAALSVAVAGEVLADVAFRPADPELADMVLLDFAAFDWSEEDEPVLGHPRDPFHRVDVRRSSRRVRMAIGSLVVAESDRPSLVFETMLPVTRFYLPREDVRVPLAPSETRTYCAYKGAASHFSVDGVGEAGIDVAWSYESPLPDCPQIAGLVAFYQERIDVSVDGVPIERPRTPWSGNG
ncbi:DUF427 domain-containing protein [Rhodococcus spelaei]|uniref:DUF427 domain-containing protein n=1 Tax=Rhodococcus spelaei TaxID=2546320 RepID=A0A541BLX9_9NOCA|nr:DUF427 domain-containing protein [Rhodococcus spelaei]TQF73301.1 DUF427 domain-containing protein [Rhodococcus spelaei]